MVFIGLFRERHKMFSNAHKAQDYKLWVGEIPQRPHLLFIFFCGVLGLIIHIISTQIIFCFSDFYELIQHSLKTFFLISYHLHSQALSLPSTTSLPPMATLQFMTISITGLFHLHFPCLLPHQIIVAFPELIFCQQATSSTHISLCLLRREVLTSQKQMDQGVNKYRHPTELVGDWKVRLHI